MSEQQSRENGTRMSGGCHPLMVCTDRPELCPPACRPVVRNAGANVIPPGVPNSPTVATEGDGGSDA
jgi:hypothetical protein